METKMPTWIPIADGKVDPIGDLSRLVEYCEGEAFSLVQRRDSADAVPILSKQKLYASSARGWRDRDSFLPRCYAIDALKENRWVTYGCDAVSPDKQFVTIRDDAVDIDREWKEKIFDNRVYRFINDGGSIRLFGSGMEPIKIELSFSELVGEE